MKIFERTIPRAPACLVFDGHLNRAPVSFQIYVAESGELVADAGDFDMHADTPEEMESKLARFNVGAASFAGYDNLE